jgi:hypothetical protein
MNCMPRPISRAELLAVLLVITAAMFTGLSAVRFHPDESHWIGLSAPFEAFVAGRFTDPLWQTRPDRHLNAPMTFYVIGAARRMGGWRPDSLNQAYRFGQPYQTNVAEGRVPPPGLLWWGRAGVTAAAVLAVLASFAVFARAAGRPAAYVWLALVLSHSYLRDTIRRAMNEGVLLLMLALCIWATYRLLAARDRQTPGRSRWITAGWAALAGTAAGLAAGTKANGGLALAGVIIVLGVAVTRRRDADGRRARSVAAAALILTVTAAFAYVGTNPTLWPNPARGTLESIRARTHVVKAQMAAFPSEAVPALSRRVKVASKRVFYDDALLPRTLSGIVLFVAGALSTLRQLYRWRNGLNDNHALAALAIIGLVVSAPAFFSPLDWPRYYVLPVFFSSFQIVVGMDWLARRIWRTLSRARAGRPDQPAGRADETDRDTEN